MSQKSVITVEDITNVALEARRTGREKGLLHEDTPVLTAMSVSLKKAAPRLKNAKYIL